MDNKKWYNRFGTIFWWSLAILPLIVVLIQFIGYHLTFNSGITSATDLANYHSNVNGDFTYLLNYYLINSEWPFSLFAFPPFITMYSNLFISLGVLDNGIFAYLLAYMTSVAFYHLIFDFMVWLPRFFHSILEKGVGKIEGK